MSKDEYYANTVNRIDTIAGNEMIWGQIIRAKEEFNHRACHDDSINMLTFSDWLLNNYGIQLNYMPDGMLSLNNNIIDKKKYIIFLLKFGEE